MLYVGLPEFRVKGWFSPTLTVDGWLDPSVTESAGGPTIHNGAAALTAQSSLSVVQRTNLVWDGSIEFDTNYTWTTGSTALSSADVKYGSWSVQYTSNGTARAMSVYAPVGNFVTLDPASPGSYAASFEVKTDTARDWRARLYYYNSSGTGLGNESVVVSVAANVWTRVGGTFTAPANTAYAEFYAEEVTASSSGAIAYLDGFFVERASALGSYFDAYSTGAGWAGTEGYSPADLGVLVISPPAASSLSAQSSLTATAAVVVAGASSLTAQSTLASDGTLVQFGASALSAQTELLPTPRNWLPNPTFETNTTGWVANGTGTTFARIATDGVSGTACVEVTKAAVASSGIRTSNTMAPVDGGDVVTVSAYVKVPTGNETSQLRVGLGFFQADGVTAVGSTTLGSLSAVSPSSGWVRVQASATAGAGTAFGRMFVVNGLTAETAGQKYLIDACTFTINQTGPVYFDGVFGGTWTGTANNSPSDATLLAIILPTATLTAQSSLTAAASVIPQASAALTAQSSLTADATIPGGGPPASNLSAQSELTAAVTLVQPAAATLTAQSSLSASATVSLGVGSSMTAQSTLTANVTLAQAAAAALTAQSSLTATGVAVISAAAAESAQSTLTAAAVLVRSGASALTAQSTLTATGSVFAGGSATLTAQSTLTAAGLKVGVSSATLTATASLTANAGLLNMGASSMSATATVRAEAARLRYVIRYKSPYERLKAGRKKDPSGWWVTERVGVSLLKEGGIWNQVIFPDEDRIRNATRCYLGGRDYELTAEERDELIAAGYGGDITEGLE